MPRHLGSQLEIHFTITMKKESNMAFIMVLPLINPWHAIRQYINLQSYTYTYTTFFDIVKNHWVERLRPLNNNTLPTIFLTTTRPITHKCHIQHVIAILQEMTFCIFILCNRINPNLDKNYQKFYIHQSTFCTKVEGAIQRYSMDYLST